MERTVGIMVHRTRPEALEFAQVVMAWLAERGIGVRLDAPSAEKLGRPLLACGAEGMQAVEFIITLGGDGTILAGARLAAPCGIPILSVHMGNFGFIAETNPGELFPYLEALLAGDLPIAERMMIQAEVWRDNHCVHSAFGLNEAVIKSGMSHLLRLRTRIADVPFATYLADGLIISTPTGSTAYALSAGGPLVHPDIEAMIVVPNNPHTLSARPLVIPCSAVLTVDIEASTGEVFCTVDSVEPFFMQEGDRVIVRRAAYMTRLVMLDPAGFYRKIRNRYLYGERLSE